MASESFNSYNPLCLRSSCLNEVAGYIEHNPVDQYSSCVSLFGSPVVTTITPTNVVLSTETTTVSYVDIVVSLTTEVSTVDQTVTVPTEVTETDTAYWTTLVDTETVTVAATSTTRGGGTGRVRGRRPRGRCARPPTTTSAAALPTASTAPPPIPPNCASQADYSSACACIYAASDATLTVTADASTVVSAVLETVSSAVPSTLESVILSLETNTVDVTSTATEATVTVTAAESSTTTVVVATEVAQFVVAGDGAYAGQVAVGVDDGTGRGLYNVLVENRDAGTDIDFVTTGGQPSMDGQPDLLLYAAQGFGNYGTLVFMNATEAAKYSGRPLMCGANDDSSISCNTTSGYSHLMVCPNGSNNWLYVWEDLTQAFDTCTAVTLSLVTD